MKMRHSSRAERFSALPAAIALLACVAATGFVSLKPYEPNPRTLQTQAEHALARGDDATALLQYQHLISMEPDQPQHAYQLAMALDRLHRRVEAMQVLEQIAPEAGGGYGPAHVQQAEWLMETRVIGADADPRLLKSARVHLAQTFTDAPTRRRAEALRLAIDAAAN